MKRLSYLDSLRGLAIVAMIINHVGHYLVSATSTSYANYLVVYLTVTWAAPLFLFVAGFSAAVTWQNKLATGETLKFDYFWRRGLWLLLLGIIINAAFFLLEGSWYFGRILLTIGSGLVLSYPVLKYLKTKQSIMMAVAIGFGLLLSYPLLFPVIKLAVTQHSILTQIVFGEFSLYPWVLVLLLGAALGRYLLLLSSEAQARLAKNLGWWGGILLVVWFFLSILTGRWWLFLFGYDYNLAGYWVPSTLTWLWIFGCILSGFAAAYGLRVKRYFWLQDLELLGKNALVLYFLQFLIIKTIGGELINIRFTGIMAIAITDFIIILSLCYLVKLKSFAKLMALNPLKARAKIS